MKKIRLNTRFLATEGVPEIVTVGIIPFTMLALFCGWVHGRIDTSLCVGVFLLCTWSTGYREWQEVKNRVSGLHFGIFGFSFLSVMAAGAKMYAMTDMNQMHRLLVLAVVMVPCITIGAKYINAIHRAEMYEEKDRQHRIAVEGYKALWTVAMFLLAYSACLWTVYYCGDALSDFLGLQKFGSWQAAMHRMLD